MNRNARHSVNELNPQQLLHWLHGISVLGQLATFAAVFWLLHVPLPWGWLLLGTGLLAAWGLLCAFRWPLSGLSETNRLTLQLGVDLLLVAWPLYFSGGGNNPFAFVLLLPVAISAAILPARRSWLLAGLAVLLYSLLVQHHRMLPSAHGHLADQIGGDFNLHVLGMWANFVLSVAVIAGVVGSMAMAIQRRNRVLADVRETQLRNEQLLHMGVLAAGAAHELNTPLATASLLVESLQVRSADESTTEDLKLLGQQLDVCAEQVRSLLSQEQGGAVETSLGEFISRVFSRWHITRPDTDARLDLPAELVAKVMVNDAGLGQTLVSLLNNAANAHKGREPLVLRVVESRKGLEFQVLDRGPGVNDQAGVPEDGRGWGLQLSRASIERLGGTLSLQPRDGGGTAVVVRLSGSRS